MTETSASSHRNPARLAYDLLTAVSMTVGRGPAARAVAALSGLSAGDRVVDIGCGPGTAVRTAARQCASVTGVDPAPEMLRLARWITARKHLGNVTFAEGRAEALPLPAASATVAWALSSVHHWPDRTAGLAEAARVLAPGGRILLAERLVKPGARGHAAHGLTPDQATKLTAALEAAGFGGVSCETRQAGRRTLLILTGTTPGVRAGLRRTNGGPGNRCVGLPRRQRPCADRPVRPDDDYRAGRVAAAIGANRPVDDLAQGMARACPDH
jgi:SAM-dependent methyltransferase